jgi:hypothetical protein
MLFERIYGTIVMRAQLTIPASSGSLRRHVFRPSIRSPNLIKLHGSANWRVPDGSATMVMGDHKTATIAASPLLAWYIDIFETVLRVGDVHLMVIGYSCIVRLLRRRPAAPPIPRAAPEGVLLGRQYDAVDPDNRLVAAELEKRWNGKLETELDGLTAELCVNLGDDVWLKAAYRGGCRACQNLPKGAIRHVERYHRHSIPSA